MRHADSPFTIGCDCCGLLKNETCPCKPRNPGKGPSLTLEDLPRHIQRYRSICFGIISRASELEKWTLSFEESLPGALKPGNLQKKSGEKEREPQGCLAGLFLVNVMENAKSLSCSLCFLLSFPFLCLTGAMRPVWNCRFSRSKPSEKGFVSLSLSWFWDIWSLCAGSCPVLLKNAVGGTLDPPKLCFNT